jgi:putative peptide zinc metalloprotease protein
MRLLGRLNPFWIKFPLPRGDRWINACAKFLRPLFSRSCVILGVLFAIAAAMVLVSRWSDFVSSSASVFHPSNWLWLIVTWVVLKILHELAHAIACQRQAATVRETGLVLILLAPLAYVDVTSCWRINSRWSRIVVASAGMYLELVIAALAVLLWAFVDAPQARFLLHNLVIAAGLSTLLFNANVLMRFDGYFILADLIEVPNLYSEASAALRRAGKRVLTGEHSAPGSLSGWRRHFVLAYGLSAFVWRITVCVSLAIAAATMFAGAGIAIAVVGIGMWGGRPLQQLYRFAVDLRGRDPSRFVRGVVVGGALLCAGGWMFFALPVPTSVTVPAVARYLPETTVRSRASGFVSRIHVADGAAVGRGDLLLELENRELSSRLAQLEITKAQHEIRLRRATDRHDAGQRQVLLENQKAVQQQLAQLRLQARGLRVLAPRSGRVIARSLEATLGTYVQEGDPLLVVAGQADKELVAVVDQDAIEDVRPLVGEKIRIRTASFDAAEGVLERIEPRATDRLPDPSLAATEGGSLAVGANESDEESDELRLLHPHFRGRIGLAADVADDVPAGTRMWASLGYRTEPIANRLRNWIRRLWHAVQDQATH